MQVFLLHPGDNFHGSWTRRHWDSVIDLGRAPKSFYDEQSAALGCPVFSIFDLAVEVEDLRIWRHLLAPGMGRVVDRFGIDWWDVISLLLQPELQDVRLALRLAEKLHGCRTLVVSRPSLMAEALRVQLGISLQVLHGGLRKRLARSVLRRGSAVANLTFEQLRQVVYDKYDPHYRWRRKLAGPIVEIAIGAAGAASDGLFECDENRIQLLQNLARAEISPGARPRVCGRLARSGKCGDGRSGGVRSQKLRRR